MGTAMIRKNNKTRAILLMITAAFCTQIVFAGIFGYVFFHQIPDALSIAGYLVIFAAAYCMFRYSRRHPD